VIDDGVLSMSEGRLAADCLETRHGRTSLQPSEMSARSREVVIRNCRGGLGETLLVASPWRVWLLHRLEE
jgi:hypothetical protein